MSKFSITRLEVARRNPVDFAKSLSASGETSNPLKRGFPKSMRWLNAVNEYHATGDIGDAITSIETWFGKKASNAANRRELRKFITGLGEYEAAVEQKGYVLVKSRETIDLSFQTLHITGIIPLIFMKAAGGFAAYFISPPNAGWQTELKYPVVQQYVGATVFKSNVSEIEVGYVEFPSGAFYEKKFTRNEIIAATQELQNITDIIIRNL